MLLLSGSFVTRAVVVIF